MTSSDNTYYFLIIMNSSYVLIPTRKQVTWENTCRIFLGVVVAVGYITFLALHTAFLASTILTALLVFFLVRPRFACLQLTLLIVIFFIAWIYNMHGSLASPSYWPFRIYATLGGTSSCTRIPYVVSPYNPNGLKYHDESELNIAFTYCPYYESRWADNTGEKPIPTSEDLQSSPIYKPCPGGCTYASKFRQDYPNLGRGLADGWTPSANYENDRMCPRVTNEQNQFGHLGIGELIPSTCAYTFFISGLIQPQHFYPLAEYNFVCTLCPGYIPAIESQNVTGMRAFFVWCVVWMAIISLWSIFTIVETSRYKLKL